MATFNVLGDSHTGREARRAGMASGPARIRGAVQLLERYGVDVVGLQEFQRPQAVAFTRLAGSTYALWSAPGDTENAIAYRRDRWSLVGAETVAIPYFNGHIRRMPVVRLTGPRLRRPGHLRQRAQPRRHPPLPPPRQAGEPKQSPARSPWSASCRPRHQ